MSDESDVKLSLMGRRARRERVTDKIVEKTLEVTGSFC